MEEDGRWEIASTKSARKKGNGKLKGPLRLTRLCLLSIILPGLLIAGPLYLRYRVYSGQVYPVGMTDMRLVDYRISTTWCQKHLVKSNATFNAYLLPNEPQIKPNPIRLTTVRHLNLEDDMKEYWGFYLLKGSSFTVSTCCRWPGAYLTVIKGHKQLRDCAYFGDDSSEEEDELEKMEKDDRTDEKPKDEGDGIKEEEEEEEEEEAASNEPWMMKKARPGVIFYGSQNKNILSEHRLSEEISNDNGNEHLNYWLEMKSQMFSGKNVNSKRNKEEGRLDETGKHVGKSDKTSAKLNLTKLEEIYDEIVKNMGSEEDEILRKMLKQLRDHLENEKIQSENSNSTDFQAKRKAWNVLQEKFNENDEDNNGAAEESEDENLTYEDLRGTFNGTSSNDRSDSEFWSSFSSSEERLINCAGLIVNLPLIPKEGCQDKYSEKVQEKASVPNKFSYTVPTNGYYFFVFSSENEIQPNYIRVQFQFEKIVYNVSNPVAACTNTTESCTLPLNFFSKEKTVLEMPYSHNESLWNQEFVVVSTCEPRTMVYAVCVIAVPVLILLFAF